LTIPREIKRELLALERRAGSEQVLPGIRLVVG
jgi:hypothetical protein